ncbi:MAG: hypothetical protein IKB98_04230 [Clostridia bacterium]|nr:hypothetical protein [Clostridia bacterium]
MKYYLKMAFMPFVFLLFTAMLGLGIILLDEDMAILQYLLCVVNTAFYSVLMSVGGFKDGQNALKIRMQNDTYRRRIIETGEDLPLQLREEYKPWKGYVIGLIAAIPATFLTLLHFVINIGATVPDNSMGMISGIINMVVFGYFMVDGVVLFGEYAFSLLYIPFICLVYGLFYQLGANKMQKQYDKIHETHRAIYGDRN